GRLIGLGEALDFGRRGNCPLGAKIGGEALERVSGPLHPQAVPLLVSGVEGLQQRRRVASQQSYHLLKKFVVVPHAAKGTVVIVNLGHDPRRLSWPQVARWSRPKRQGSMEVYAPSYSVLEGGRLRAFGARAQSSAPPAPDSSFFCLCPLWRWTASFLSHPW